MDGGAWWATVHGVTKSRTQLSDFTFTFYYIYKNYILNIKSHFPVVLACLSLFLIDLKWLFSFFTEVSCVAGIRTFRPGPVFEHLLCLP